MLLRPVTGNFPPVHLSNNKEQFTPKSKIILFSGFLGAGKTTCINNIFPHIQGKTKIIVNDVGSINIDATRFGDKDTVALQEGCVCCEDEKSLREALEQIKQDEQETGEATTIILEPSGIADGKTITNILKQKGFPIKTITLFDGNNFEEQRNINTISREIFDNQLRVADIIGVTKIEEIPNELKNIINQINDSAAIIGVPQNAQSEVFANIWKQIEELQTDKKQQIQQVFSLKKTETQANHNNPLISHSSEVALSKTDIFLIKSLLGNTLPRAKGVLKTGESFDIVGGDINFENTAENTTFCTLIATEDFDIENVLKQISEIKEYSLSKRKIGNLVKDYHDYMKLYNEKKSLEQELNSKQDISTKITKLELEMQELGESMKYDNPYIWLQYKIEAYKDSDNSIKTVEDLINHCNVPDYICGKRLAFMHKHLQEIYDIDIYKLDGDTDLNDFLKNNTFQELSQSKDFIEQWLKYEYFIDEGKVAKWENYTE